MIEIFICAVIGAGAFAAGVTALVQHNLNARLAYHIEPMPFMRAIESKKPLSIEDHERALEERRSLIPADILAEMEETPKQKWDREFKQAMELVDGPLAIESGSKKKTRR